MMDEDNSAGGAHAADPLYDWWFEALPALFKAAVERRETPAAGVGIARKGEAEKGKPPEPTAARVSHALALAQQLLNSVYAACFGALAGRPAEQALPAFEEMLRGGLDQLGERWDAVAGTWGGAEAIAGALKGLTGGHGMPASALLKPLASNMERTYGGLADAFGLAPMRELDAAVRDLALASLAQRRAQAEYLRVGLIGARQGADALFKRLAEMGERGESVDTMLALLRLFASTMDGAMHEAMQSPLALEASAEAIRAGLRARQQQHRVVAIASEALNVPTRAEVDEAYREIQQLKREVRRLRKSAPEAPPEAAPSKPRKTPARRASARAAATA